MKKTRVEANGEGRDALFAGVSGAEATNRVFVEM